ncbi:MAG: flagellar biosynthetic protein FliQ [Phycisphaerales bacterium]|nr:flagellar biosynthetic protein FliQ [Phycisphaerales bacterium]
MSVDDYTMQIVRDTLMMALTIIAPVLGAGIVIGLIISILQSITQIHEQTLTMVPKIFVMIGVAILLMPWIVAQLTAFAVEMFNLGL